MEEVMTSITRVDTIEEKLDRLETAIADLRSEINQLYRWTIASIFAAISLGLAASRILG